MKIIGFGCTAQVGKDTAAEHLETRFPGSVKRVAFADKVKDVGMLVFGLSHEQCYGSQEIKETVDPRYDLTPREILQGIGQKLREIYDLIWVDSLFNTTIPEAEEAGFDCAVISDVRYPNEGDKVHTVGGTLVKVTRKGSGVTVGAEHSSETAMRNYTNFDFIIENNESLPEYLEKIDKLVEAIGYGGEERQDDYRRTRVRPLVG